MGVKRRREDWLGFADSFKGAKLSGRTALPAPNVPVLFQHALVLDEPAICRLWYRKPLDATFGENGKREFS